MTSADWLSVLAPLVFASVAGTIVLIFVELDRGRLFELSMRKLAVASALAALLGGVWAAIHQS